MLQDQHSRVINYLRIAVTDKCNLRCYYCMPEEGIPFWEKSKVLSYEELIRVTSLLVDNGINKLRITGGEPFVRKDLPYFLKEVSNLKNAPALSITTNATLIHQHIDLLKSIGLQSINVSLDSLDKDRFYDITRRDYFHTVYTNLISLINEGFDVKVNCVVMKDKNIEDILPIAHLAADHKISVRFLEEMPFNGQAEEMATLHWDFTTIKNHLSDHLGEMDRLIDQHSATATRYKIKGFKGDIGIIPSFSRTFCGTCNRIRISANGDFRTCLYGAPAINLRKKLRDGLSDDDLLNDIKCAISKKPKNGFEAERELNKNMKGSMAYIGG